MRRDYTLHCLRAFLGGFTPLTFAQFVALRGSIWATQRAAA